MCKTLTEAQSTPKTYFSKYITTTLNQNENKEREQTRGEPHNLYNTITKDLERFLNSPSSL